MQRHLGWIAIAGFAVAAIFLGGAWLLTGRGGPSDIARHFSEWNLPRCGPLSGRPASREIAWDGADKVGIAIPATLRYRPGTGDNVKVVGDTSLVSHVHIDQGEIKLDCRPDHMTTESLDITMPGSRSFRTFSLASVTSLILNDIDQPELHFNLAGSSTVMATGRVESVHVNGAGMSDAQLGDLAAQEVKLNLAGASTAEVAATDSLAVNAVGAVTVVLRTEPKSIRTNIVGSGRIIHKSS
jgi:hypothetical protein